MTLPAPTDLSDAERAVLASAVRDRLAGTYIGGEDPEALLSLHYRGWCELPLIGTAGCRFVARVTLLGVRMMDALDSGEAG